MTSRTGTTGRQDKVVVKLASSFMSRFGRRTSLVVDTPRIRWRRVHSICASVLRSACWHWWIGSRPLLAGPHRVRNTRGVSFPQLGTRHSWRWVAGTPRFSPKIQLLLDLGLIINPQSRATHVVGAASDLVLVSTHLECVHLECVHFTVHQGDSCCVSSPLCCPSLTSDHFPCTWSFRGDQRSSSPGGQSNSRSAFPESNLGC